VLPLQICSAFCLRSIPPGPCGDLGDLSDASALHLDVERYALAVHLRRFARSSRPGSSRSRIAVVRHYLICCLRGDFACRDLSLKETLDKTELSKTNGRSPCSSVRRTHRDRGGSRARHRPDHRATLANERARVHRLRLLSMILQPLPPRRWRGEIIAAKSTSPMRLHRRDRAHSGGPVSLSMSRRVRAKGPAPGRVSAEISTHRRCQPQGAFLSSAVRAG